ncbi:hypothetical protein M153_1470001674 [Pseudoloma neurophilia]|uniref:Uncharacterized protein n=1 Tax=Pseudoloma neurophilia TaxID=146866 RepID=A0A0R0LZW1_9MICR|nr:hypothetical protein M153_1470001674 [Pseudoloma neurophilia]
MERNSGIPNHIIFTPLNKKQKILKKIITEKSQKNKFLIHFLVSSTNLQFFAEMEEDNLKNQISKEKESSCFEGGIDQSKKKIRYILPGPLESITLQSEELIQKIKKNTPRQNFFSCSTEKNFIFWGYSAEH